jgi:dipeptidyl aminopeptidase/acylaminoacyl peptidase
MSLLVLTAGCSQTRAASAEAKVVASTGCFDFDALPDWAKTLRDPQGGARPAAMADAFFARFSQATLARYRQSLECAFIRYEANGVTVSGFFAKPATAGRGKLPAVIYNRGGNGDLGRVNFAQLFTQVLPLAERGFFVIGSQYREEDEFGGKDVDDVLALLDLIDARPEVDGNRVGMMGHSRGGLQTVIAASRSDRFKAIALLGAPADLLEDLRLRPDMARVYERRIPNYSDDPVAALRVRSPLTLLEAMPAAMPVLILHGGADERAHPENALRLASRLLELRRTYKLVIYPDADHALSRLEPEVRDELARWFGTYLADPAVR